MPPFCGAPVRPNMPKPAAGCLVLPIICIVLVLVLVLRLRHATGGARAGAARDFKSGEDKT